MTTVSSLMAQKKKATKSRRKKPTVQTKDSISIVCVRESVFDEWIEVVELTAISRFGASLSLNRECRVGRLISLSLADSKRIKTQENVDLAKSVVCLVQQCTEVTVLGKPVFHIGVVFVGNAFPSSYDLDPQQCYRISGNEPNGLFKITEVEGQFRARRHPRFQMELQLNLLLINTVDRSIERSTGVTRDVSASGALVVCTLDANPGDKIKVGCREIDFYGIAVVKERRCQFGYELQLHLQFIEERFPIERVLFGSIMESVAA